MDYEVIVTRTQLRIAQAHKERDGQDDLNVGYRMGLLHALNILKNAIADEEATARRNEDVSEEPVRWPGGFDEPDYS